MTVLQSCQKYSRSRLYWTSSLRMQANLFQNVLVLFPYQCRGKWRTRLVVVLLCWPSLQGVEKNFSTWEKQLSTFLDDCHASSLCYTLWTVESFEAVTRLPRNSKRVWTYRIRKWFGILFQAHTTFNIFRDPFSRLCFPSNSTVKYVYHHVISHKDYFLSKLTLRWRHLKPLFSSSLSHDRQCVCPVHHHHASRPEQEALKCGPCVCMAGNRQTTSSCESILLSKLFFEKFMEEGIKPLCSRGG